MADVESLSNEELHEQLKSFGIAVGPVTGKFCSYRNRMSSKK
jgi:hypothetical protein